MSIRSNPRVLVVDDWRDAADSLAQLLTLWGYDAEACYGGVAALAVARTYRPDVVLLDVGMPGLDGFQVALGLREMPGLAGTTIVGLTGYSDEDCQISALEAGFDHCLLKPVELPRLRELIGGVVLPLGEFRRGGALTADGGRTRREVFAG
jgi:CheY-like chemotaxis protein